MAVSVLWQFLTIPWVGLQCFIEVFPDNINFMVQIKVKCILYQKAQECTNISLLACLSSFKDGLVSCVTRFINIYGCIQLFFVIH